MCGIIGFLDKAGQGTAPVGNTVLTMLKALACRGPDSAGVALYTGSNNGHTVLRIKLGENGDFAGRRESITERVQALGEIHDISTTEEYLRLELDFQGDPQQLGALIESEAADVEVVSMGNALEIVKQVGSPQNLEQTHGVSRITGTHGIGHTRLSTESRVDLSHSQPFWAHGVPDLAVVHNGHITNVEQKGTTIVNPAGMREVKLPGMPQPVRQASDFAPAERVFIADLLVTKLLADPHIY